MRNSLISLAKSYGKLNPIVGKNFFSVQAALRSGDVKKFTDKHEWISIKDSIGTVGITDYAQDKLGEVVYLELPSIGHKLQKGDSFATLESVKAVSECYAPVTGEVVEINQKLPDTPNLLNKASMSDGLLKK